MIVLLNVTSAMQEGTVLRLRKTPKHTKRHVEQQQQGLVASCDTQQALTAAADAAAAAHAALEAAIWQPVIPDWHQLGELCCASTPLWLIVRPEVWRAAEAEPFSSDC